MTRRQPIEGRVRKLAARLHAKLGVDQVLLFGSTAKGNRLEASDVDIIVISKGFEDIPIPERQGMIQREWEGPEELQTLAYTPQEFSVISGRVTVQEILSHAIDITPAKDATCPKCGRKGSPHIKMIKSSSGRTYPYLYYAHYKKGRVEWCYIGKERFH